jgi:hypothetical protein
LAGHCQGGVIFFDKCENININNCILNGSGAFGIQCNDVTNLTCTKTTIRECSSLLFEFKGSKKLNFIECEFNNIRSHGYLAIITDCEFFKFENCIFSENYSDTNDRYYKAERDFLFYFFDDTKSKSFIFDNCVFSNNRIKWWSNKNEIITKTRIKYLNNDNLK